MGRGHDRGTHFDKAAMLVPTRIESLPYAFTLELDLGATSTMLYGNTLIPYMKLSPTLPNELDTITKRFRLEGQMNGGFRNLSLAFDGHPFTIPDVAYFKDFGDSLTMDSARSGTPKYIGSLGAPFFGNKVLIIDYPNHRFRLEDSLDKKGEARFEFAACKMQNGRIKIPFVIGGQTYWPFWDI
jgi:hypothetical protein